jgi:hypothetical protein
VPVKQDAGATKAAARRVRVGTERGETHRQLVGQDECKQVFLGFFGRVLCENGIELGDAFHAGAAQDLGDLR